MFAGIIKVIKGCGQVKAALEAVDDDVDLDGKRETEELKECFENLVQLGKEFFAEASKGFRIAVVLIEHVAKSVKEA